MLRHCSDCQELFVSSGSVRCRRCIGSLAADLERIRDFLRSEPDADINAIIAATGVSRRRILEFIQQGRLQLKTKEPGTANVCAICRSPIPLGRICGRCLLSLGQQRGRQDAGVEQGPLLGSKASTNAHLYALARRRPGRDARSGRL